MFQKSVPSLMWRDLQKSSYYFPMLVLFGILLGIYGCMQMERPGEIEQLKPKLPASKVGTHYQVMIETPAGEVETIHFNSHTGWMDTLSSSRRDYLPHPVNFGFIPRFQADSLHKIPVWILGKRLPPADSLPVNLIGLMEYQVRKEVRREWLAVPVDTLKQTVGIQTFRELIMEYDPVKFMLEYWIKNRYDLGEVTNLIWSDEKKAVEQLETYFNQ